jgi:hypothetical protein
MSAYYKPTSSFNWADDDEDDFDLATFERNSTTFAAPTLEELGPLQFRVPEQGDATYHPLSTADLLEAQKELNAIFKRTPKPPSDPRSYERPCAALHQYNKNYKCEKPAYALLSSAEGVRESYAANWRELKVKCGGYSIPRGETFMVAKTELRDVWTMDEDGEEKKVEEVLELVEQEDETDDSSADSGDERWEVETVGTLTPPPEEVHVGVDEAKEVEEVDAPPLPTSFTDGDDCQDMLPLPSHATKAERSLPRLFRTLSSIWRLLVIATKCLAFGVGIGSLLFESL